MLEVDGGPELGAFMLDERLLVKLIKEPFESPARIEWIQIRGRKLKCVR